MRFDMDAKDRAGAARYLSERAHQALADGFRPACKEVEPLVDAGTEWGCRATLTSPTGVLHQSVYVYAASRGQGHTSRYLAASDVPVVTIPDCAIEEWLTKRNIAFTVIARHTEYPEYIAIERHYDDRCAKRSGVPFIHHIDEGIAVLRKIGASEDALRAFCIHPLLQGDADLTAFAGRLDEVTADRHVLLLAMEYRNIANATLSHRVIESPADIPLSPLREVNDMLIADKVQNRKDFLLHHAKTHARGRELDRYFRLWLERLGVSEGRYEELALIAGGADSAGR